MYELLVSGHYPNINEKNVPRNATIKVILSDEIDVNSIKDTNLTVVDYVYNPVEGIVAFDYSDKGTPSSIANILTFTPKTYLDPETNYFVYVNKYPDSVKSVNDNFIQDTYKFIFTTGIQTIEDSDPTFEDLLRMDLEAAIAREDWCEAARISSLLDKEQNSCPIVPSGITPIDPIDPINPIDPEPEYLILSDSFPKNNASDVPLEKLRFIKLSFNDEMPDDGVDYNSFITVMNKHVLE